MYCKSDEHYDKNDNKWPNGNYSFFQSMVIGVVGVDGDQSVLARRAVGGAKD